MKSVFRIFALLLLIATSAIAQAPEPLMTYGIVGDGGGAYTDAMDHIEVQKLLLAMAETPRNSEYIEKALSGSGVSRGELEKLGLIRARGSEYVISFTLLTAEDVRKTRDVSERFARTLARAFLDRRKEIDAALQNYRVEGVDPKAVSYFLLGCFSLDWDGLDVTKDHGYRTVPKAQTGDGSYIPWAEQKSDISLKGIYWGSHNSTYGTEVQFTSFGDHFSLPRYALPDLLWRLLGRATQGQWPESLKPPIQGLMRSTLGNAAREMGLMLFALRRGKNTTDELAAAAGVPSAEAKPLLDLLVALEYVSQQGEHFVLRVPVLDKEDAPLVRELRRIGREVMESWLAANYENFKKELGEITPVRYGVTYAHGFTQIWHYIFGVTNRQLVEAGLFADPYAQGRKYLGFTPAVFHPSLE